MKRRDMSHRQFVLRGSAAAPEGAAAGGHAMPIGFHSAALIPLISLFLIGDPAGAAPRQIEAVPLLPGARIFDATRTPFGATPDDETDDTAAIQAAIDAAAAAAARAEGDRSIVAQQIVFLPSGTYRISDTLAFPKNVVAKGQPIERSQWLRGAGMGRTRLRLRPAKEGRLLGEANAPKPVVQAAEYRFDNKSGGNSNFQLWVTDLSIIVADDQPHAVGLSYGSANMGAVRRVEIVAEGPGGHTGLALVQYNNGPGLIEHVRVRGFATGVEINDNWGESFTFSDLSIEHQGAGGTGLSISDKMIAVENLRIVQNRPDVTAILLHDGAGKNSFCGGAPHLSLLGAIIENTAAGGATAPGIEVRAGHVYLRDLAVRGYGDAFLSDHGRRRSFAGGQIDGEFVSVHGRAIGERDNVAVTVGGAPAQSLDLPVRPTPEIPAEAWRALDRNDFTVFTSAALAAGARTVPTAWVVVDPRDADDGGALLQAALDSGARFVGLLNTGVFRVSQTLVVNGPGTPRRVEAIVGLMSEILVDKSMAGRKEPYEKIHPAILFRIETGILPHLHIKGLRVQPDLWHGADFTLFHNHSAGTVVFEDIRAKTGPRHYRNGVAAEGRDLFIENVEWAYNDAFPQDNVVFTRQRVWARNLNVEMNITPDPVKIKTAGGGALTFSRFSTHRKIVNDGGTLWSFGQKVGEYNGPFFENRDGGRTELLSVFINQANDPAAFPPVPAAACVMMRGPGGEMSLVGQERPRGPRNAPHANTMARIEATAGWRSVPVTRFPTYLVYGGFDPFGDSDPERYFEQNTFRVFGLFRCRGERSAAE